ncbi:hypothetical protein FRC09_009167 [Ceratobasidium sp. 395]|nr:hypothetical protein FRC09_009167 [Ceratobasidium sp. 395]
MSGIQFVTNLGRVSPHYGGYGNTPTVLRSTNGCLVAFCGRLVSGSEAEENKIYQLQIEPTSVDKAVWRHDIMKTLEFQYSSYFGGSGGFPFNDRAYIGTSGSGFIKSVRVKSSLGSDKQFYMENIQVRQACRATLPL